MHPLRSAVHPEYLVEGLPGVGRRRVQQLLWHFGSPAAVMRATREELLRAPGVGAKGADASAMR